MFAAAFLRPIYTSIAILIALCEFALSPVRNMRLYDSADGKYSATPAMLMMDWLDCKRRKRAVTNWSAFVLKFQKFPL
jgi:hypothetical protein